MAVAATSEIVTKEVEVAVIDCVALFYEEGNGGENYRKKKIQVSGEERRKTARQAWGEHWVSLIGFFHLVHITRHVKTEHDLI